jgi:hypothetical protein
VSDWTAHVRQDFARPSGASTFVGTRDVSSLDIGSPVLSDPNTGAMGTSLMLPVANNALVSFSLVLGLFLLTMWLETGKKGGVL